MALTSMKQIRTVGATPAVNRRTNVVMASTGKSKAAAAAAAATLLLASTPAFAAPPMVPTTRSADPVALVSEDAGKDLRQRLKEAFTSRVPKVVDKVKEDPFGADRAQAREVADTKRPIAIPTEQEAVAPEAFPNPSQAISPRPPVLAAAEGDEHLGANAGQFQGLDESGRQGLIDAKSPAQSSK